MGPMVLSSSDRQDRTKLCHRVGLRERADDHRQAAPDEGPRPTIPERCVDIAVMEILLMIDVADSNV